MTPLTPSNVHKEQLLSSCSPICEAHVAVGVVAGGVQQQRERRHDGLHQHKLQRALLATPQEEAIHLQGRRGGVCEAATVC